MELWLVGVLRLEVDPVEEKTAEVTVRGDDCPLLASRSYAEPLDWEDGLEFIRAEIVVVKFK